MPAPTPVSAAARVLAPGRPVPAEARTQILIQPELLTKLAEARDIGLADYRAETITLLTSLSTTTTSGNDTFNIPPDKNFMLTDVRGYLALTAMTSETLAIVGLGNPSVQDRVLIKGMNTKIDLQIQNLSLKLFDNRPVALAAILPALGGPPIKYPAPHPVPGGSQIRLDTSLYDTTASIIGAGYDAGVVLSGYFVSAAE